MSTLILLTESYPLGGLTESSFIAPEIEFLAHDFDRVIVAPVMNRGNQLPLPENVVVDESLLNRPGTMAKAASLLRPDTWIRLNNDGGYIHSWRKCVAALAFTTYAHHYRKLLNGMIHRWKLDLNDTLFYTFWFDFRTAALSGIKGARFVTRAHGYDIYDSQNPFISHSWRNDTFRAILKCFPVSGHGADYLGADYPDWQEKIATRRLGSATPVGVNPPEPGQALTVLSIGRVAPEKRVDLMLRSIDELARSMPSQQFHWLHIGSGSEKAMISLRQLAGNVATNLTVEFAGAMDNADIHRLLASRHFDFCMMLSSSEGLPIAACESLSYGIPVVASAVGGLPEIVIDGKTGILLSPHPSPAEFARRVSALIPDLQSMRGSARKLWETELNALPLRQAFASELRSILDHESYSHSVDL